MTDPMGNSKGDRSQLASQQVRSISFEGDALRMSMDWSIGDLAVPQVLVETTAGASHPSSFHLGDVATAISNGVYQAGAKPANFTTTDICDGVAQAHEGMRYPLASREVIANMVEMHCRATPFDALVLASSGDKAVPAHLMAIARLDIPAVFVPGGAMTSGPQFRSNEELWNLRVSVDEGRVTEEEFLAFQRFACPGCGACQYMGTAATMQVMAEALGIALPWSALIPADLAELRRMARSAGQRVVELVDTGVTARKILTREAFENAIAVHAAIGGSLNAVMHLVNIAREADVALSARDFDEIHRRTPVLVDAKTAGNYPTELFWYAGGVPALMMEISNSLHLDTPTVSGLTLGENLERLNGTELQRHASLFLENYKVDAKSVIHPINDPVYTSGSTVLLSGNLFSAALVKSHAMDESMLHHTGPARVFDTEETAVDAVRSHHVQPGDVVIVRYQGPRATGMPEMFFLSELVAADPRLAFSTALITDGRFSGASRGPCIGYAQPEALEGGLLAAVEDGDLIEIDIASRRVELVGTHGLRRGADAIAVELDKRMTQWEKPTVGHGGALGQYTALARPALDGAGIATHT